MNRVLGLLCQSKVIVSGAACDTRMDTGTVLSQLSDLITR